MLVDDDADPNTRAINPHSPLKNNSPATGGRRGGGTVVRTLLRAGADPNAQRGHYGGGSATMIEEKPVREGSPGYGQGRK